MTTEPQPDEITPESAPEGAHVAFGDVASESVHESVEQEREITLADDVDLSATEPYLPVDDAAALEADGALDSGLLDERIDPAGLPEETDLAQPSGGEVVNSITAAIRL